MAIEFARKYIGIEFYDKLSRYFFHNNMRYGYIPVLIMCFLMVLIIFILKNKLNSYKYNNLNKFLANYLNLFSYTMIALPLIMIDLNALRFLRNIIPFFYIVVFFVLSHIPQNRLSIYIHMVIFIMISFYIGIYRALPNEFLVSLF